MNKLLKNYEGDMSVINKFIHIGVLTTVTEDGKPRTGVTESGTPWINGLNFIKDGTEGKKASFIASAFDDVAVEIAEALKAQPINEEYKAPFMRIQIGGRIERNSWTDDETGEVKYDNRLVITDVWNAPVKDDAVYVYPSNESNPS